MFEAESILPFVRVTPNMTSLNSISSISSHEDREEIEAVLAGDTSAFDRLVKKYQRKIYYLALRMLGNTEDADEVTQKTFLKGYRALAGFRFEASFKTWLTTIAINLCRTELSRRRYPQEEISEHIPDLSGEEKRGEEEEHEHRLAHLKEVLETLPARQKEVVVLRIFHDMPFKEIAEALKSNETAVKVNFHHAMKGLRERIQKRLHHEKM